MQWGAGRDLARAVLCRAFLDATAVLPTYSGSNGVAQVREAKATALVFLLSRSVDAQETRAFWFYLAGREEPTTERMKEIIERHAVARELDHGGEENADTT
jgi:hypothetical protein